MDSEGSPKLRLINELLMNGKPDCEMDILIISLYVRGEYTSRGGLDSRFKATGDEYDCIL